MRAPFLFLVLLSVVVFLAPTAAVITSLILVLCLLSPSLLTFPLPFLTPPKLCRACSGEVEGIASRVCLACCLLLSFPVCSPVLSRFLIGLFLSIAFFSALFPFLLPPYLDCR